MIKFSFFSEVQEKQTKNDKEKITPKMYRKQEQDSCKDPRQYQIGRIIIRSIY